MISFLVTKSMSHLCLYFMATNMSSQMEGVWRRARIHPLLLLWQITTKCPPVRGRTVLGLEVGRGSKSGTQDPQTKAEAIPDAAQENPFPCPCHLPVTWHPLVVALSHLSSPDSFIRPRVRALLQQGILPTSRSLPNDIHKVLSGLHGKVHRGLGCGQLLPSLHRGSVLGPFTCVTLGQTPSFDSYDEDN